MAALITGDIAGTVRGIIASLMDSDKRADRIKPSSRIREDLGFDSVLIIDLMVELESRLGVYFDPYVHDLVEIFNTVGSLEEFVSSSMRENG